MSYQSDDFEDGKIFNLLQVIALDVALTISLTAALKLSGNSWFFAIMGAWFGGAFMTIGTLAAAVWLHFRFEQRLERKIAKVSGNTAPDREPKQKPPLGMIAIWEEDANLDSEEARVSPKRPLRHERRNGNLPFQGKDRRKSRR
ncbi:MAG: hypothetical protein ABJ360_06650 [Roseobacter sp.]